MTAAPDTPFWNVTAVFDPEGNGGDFAYTVGLAGVGQPELHLWARPSTGDDPGDDWMFSPRDRGSLLNEFARSLLDGTLKDGDTFTRTFDGGDSLVTFTVGPAVAAAEVEAFGVGNAPVLPIRWSLQRIPEGPVRPLETDVQKRYCTDLAAVISALDPDRVKRLPVAWRPVTPLSFDPGQPFGPLAAAVIVRGAELATVNDEELLNFCQHAMMANESISAAQVLSLVLAQARPVGRTEAVQATLGAAFDLVDYITGTSTPTPAFRTLIAEVASPKTDAEYKQAASALRFLLQHAVAALLATEALGDVANADLLRAGRGVWAWSQTDTFDAPGPDWIAPDDVLDAVHQLLASDDPTGAALALGRAQQVAWNASEGSEGRDGSYQGLFWRLRAHALVNEANLPEGFAVFGDDIYDNKTEAEQNIVYEAEVAAAALTAARAFANELSDLDHTILTTAFGGTLPGLADFLKAPDGR